MKKVILKFCAVVSIVSGFALGSDHGYEADIKSTELLKTRKTVAEQPVQYLKTDKPEVTALKVEIPPGKETGWHKHTVPAFGYILSGKLTLEIEGGTVLRFEAGQAFVESMNVLHNGKNSGTEPLKIVAFYAGEEGKPNTVKSVEEKK